MVCMEKQSILNMAVLDWSNFPEDLYTGIPDLQTSGSKSIKKFKCVTALGGPSNITNILRKRCRYGRLMNTEGLKFQ